MPETLFLFDYKQNQTYFYQQLIDDLNNISTIKEYCYTKGLYDTLLSIISGCVHNIGITLLDTDFSMTELNSLGVNEVDLNHSVSVDKTNIKDIEHLLDLFNDRMNWNITLFTSGTTGLPKKIIHNLSSLSRAVRKSDRHKHDIWGFAYNPTHIAGLQVFFQALFNINSIINLFEAGRNTVLQLINQYCITNISATPTFFRLLLPLEETYNSVTKLTSGGEKFDTGLSENLIKAFPNAKLRNVYASTEAGTILESKDDVFSIIDDSRCRIINGELHIHKSLMGVTSKIDSDTVEWYNTGDIVEEIEAEPLKFRFLHRKNEIINVGGYKVNPYEVEQALESHPLIARVYVYGKPNPLLGNILMADVVSLGNLSEKDLREFLMPLLQPYKIPRMINFVDNIRLTRSGKLKRI